MIVIILVLRVQFHRSKRLDDPAVRRKYRFYTISDQMTITTILEKQIKNLGDTNRRPVPSFLVLKNQFN